MESSGKPGMVHISEKTYAFLKDQYFVLDGEDVGGKFVYTNFKYPKFIYCFIWVFSVIPGCEFLIIETGHEIC